MVVRCGSLAQADPQPSIRRDIFLQEHPLPSLKPHDANVLASCVPGPVVVVDMVRLLVVLRVMGLASSPGS